MLLYLQLSSAFVDHRTNKGFSLSINLNLIVNYNFYLVGREAQPRRTILQQSAIH